MLTDKDIKKLTNALVGRDEFQTANTKMLNEIFITRKDLEDFRKETKESFSNLQTSIDRLAKILEDYIQEMKMLAVKVDRHEKWIFQIAKKLDMKLKT